MFSKYLIKIALVSFFILLLTAGAESRKTASRRARGMKSTKDGTEAPAKEAKDTKSPKTEAKSPKAPKSEPKDSKSPASKEPKAPKAPKTGSPDTGTPAPKSTKSDTSAPTPVAEPITNDEQTLSPSDSSTELFASTKAPGLDADILNCTVDSDCGEGWFCMENFTTCCEYNTTCRVGGPMPEPTSSAISLFYGIATTLCSGIVIAIALW